VSRHIFPALLYDSRINSFAASTSPSERILKVIHPARGAKRCGSAFTLFQHRLLVFFGEPDVKVRSSMSVHEFETVDLEFCAA